eukprot:NODE_281_length_1712_cov_44.669885.p1 GENE.NODE_281_length_1712_cov_44.669885~~NODE_281_length_1712_cov_44.669885.p1  ORF type:complete len:526 (-),score=175.71 NODE_281_length_1712_cov_44.669885:117-1694(-)
MGEAGPVLGLSDFNLLYNGEEEEEEPDAECLQQLSEARQTLEAADEKVRQMLRAHKEAAEQNESAAQGLRECLALIKQQTDCVTAVAEQLQGKRRFLVQVTRAESASQHRIRKAEHAKQHAEEQHLRATAAAKAAESAASITGHRVPDELAAACVAAEAFSWVVADAEAQLKIVDDAGKAAAGTLVDASMSAVRAAQRVAAQLEKQAHIHGVRVTELELAGQELSKAATAHMEATFVAATTLDAMARTAAEIALKSHEKESTSAEQAFTRAQERSEAAQQATAQAAQAFAEAGGKFAESFEKARHTPVPVRAEHVKATAKMVSAAFRQLVPACTAAKRARDNWMRAAAASRKAEQKAFALAAQAVELAQKHTEAAAEHAVATDQEKVRQREHRDCEAEIAELESLHSDLKVKDADMRRKYEHLKAVLALAKDDVKKARAAEKEAANERRALHTRCSKVEEEHSRMEEAKTSAISKLKDEKYDAGQVAQAAAGKRKASEGRLSGAALASEAPAAATPRLSGRAQPG